MKEIIKKKMDEHIERILTKEEITNEDYYLLHMIYAKIEGEEKLAEMQAKNESDRAKQREIYESTLRNIFELGGK